MVLQKESLSSANMLLVEACWSLPGFLLLSQEHWTTVEWVMCSPWYNHFEVKPSSVKHTSVHVKVSVNPNYRTFTCWYVFMQAVVVLCVRVSDCLLWSSQDWKHHTADSLHCVYLCSNSMCLRYPHRRGNASVKTTSCLSICHICCSRARQMSTLQEFCTCFWRGCYYTGTVIISV